MHLRKVISAKISEIGLQGDKVKTEKERKKWKVLKPQFKGENEDRVTPFPNYRQSSGKGSLQSQLLSMNMKGKAA